MTFAVGFLYMVFIMLRYVPSLSSFWRFYFLIINWCWILSKAFSASMGIITWFLFFNSLLWYNTLIDLQILKNPCILGMNPAWSWYMMFLMYCWIQIASILLRIFASMLIRDELLAHNFLFLWCLSFCYKGDGSLIEWVWKFSFLCKFLEQFEKDGL